jgi:hypothetical protein
VVGERLPNASLDIQALRRRGSSNLRGCFRALGSTLERIEQSSKQITTEGNIDTDVFAMQEGHTARKLVASLSRIEAESLCPRPAAVRLAEQITLQSSRFFQIWTSLQQTVKPCLEFCNLGHRLA